MKAIRIIYGLVLLLLLNSCNRFHSVPDGVEETLTQAGDNRKELFKAIQHYQENNDSLKLKAAIFLISNMKDKNFLSGKEIDTYYQFIDSIFQIKQQEYDVPALREAFTEKTGITFKTLHPDINYDAKSLSAEYLINNIDNAFAVWNKSWNKHLNFSDFCELILPYRIGNELPEEWRPRFQNEYGDIINSDSATALEVCTQINDTLINKSIRIYPDAILPINLRASSLANIKFGLCGDCVMLAVYAMRALGIPVAECIVPHWGLKNSAHSFNALYNNDKKFYDFLGTEANPGEHLKMFFDYVPKIYMKTYSKQETSLAMQSGDEDIPYFFKNPYLKDITTEFPAINTRNVSIAVQNKTKNKFAYLCVFDPQGWTAVAWGNIKNNKVTFQTIGTDIVYHLALFQNKQIQLIGNPFYLNKEGEIHYYTPQSTTFDKVLERKNPESNSWEHISQQLIGGVFQGSNTRNFENPITFHTIEEEPDLRYITIDVNNQEAVKYVRYRSSELTLGNMGEVEFYEEYSNVPLKGKPFGKYKPSTYFPRNGVDKLFDGDPLTFFHSSDTLSWGALELSHPAKISRIRYIMRNDDNGIRKGHEYELFYMKDGTWRSLGKQIATKDDSLLYKSLPKGALYWLRDYTKGREERIFEINNNGKIIWR
nr:discoidin domain-containing protein [uncultured Bacteroides sp.]